MKVYALLTVFFTFLLLWILHQMFTSHVMKSLVSKC